MMMNLSFQSIVVALLFLATLLDNHRSNNNAVVVVVVALSTPPSSSKPSTTTTSTSTTAAASSNISNNNNNKGICETTIIKDTGRAEVLCTNPDLPSTPSSLWSDVAINAAKQFTISQRQKLKDLGALEMKRPIQIIGEPLIDTCSLGDCTIIPTSSSSSAFDDDDENDEQDYNNNEYSDKEENENNNNNGNDNVDTKIIHFQRHGQGYHNLICDMWREVGRPIDFDSIDPNLNPVIRPEFLDPPLTALGMQQCRSQRSLCSNLHPDLIIVSPMLRCIQTAKLSFRDHIDNNIDIDIDTTTKNKKVVPWISHEGCREELGLLVGNKRRPINEIVEDYPEIDFTSIEHNEDVLWDDYDKENRRETLLEKSDRIYNFLTEFVRYRPEKEIAIVCHSAYLFTLLNGVMDIEDEELRNWFLTSEVRSLKMTFSDR